MNFICPLPEAGLKAGQPQGGVGKGVWRKKGVWASYSAPDQNLYKWTKRVHTCWWKEVITFTFKFWTFSFEFCVFSRQCLSRGKQKVYHSWYLGKLVINLYKAKVYTKVCLWWGSAWGYCTFPLYKKIQFSSLKICLVIEKRGGGVWAKIKYRKNKARTR